MKNKIFFEAKQKIQKQLYIIKKMRIKKESKKHSDHVSNLVAIFSVKKFICQ